MTAFEIIWTSVGGSATMLVALGLLFKSLIETSIERALDKERHLQSQELQTQRAGYESELQEQRGLFEKELEKVRAELNAINAKTAFQYSEIFPKTSETLAAMVEGWVTVRDLLLDLKNAVLNTGEWDALKPKCQLQMEALVTYSAKNQLYIPESLDLYALKVTNTINAMFEQIKTHRVTLISNPKGERAFLQDLNKTMDATHDALTIQFYDALRQFRKQIGVPILESKKTAS